MADFNSFKVVGVNNTGKQVSSTRWNTFMDALSALSVGTGAFIASAAGAISRTIQSKLGDLVHVKDFGAVLDGVADDTAAIQAAINTGKPVDLGDGPRRITQPLTCSTTGQSIRGRGRNNTVFKINNTFNLGAAGVFVFTSGEVGPELREFGIEFTQPDTNVRASLTTYPPAIFAQATPRFVVDRLRITRATTGIDMRGNSGGAFITKLEISSFNFAIRIDGSLDSVRFKEVHHWPFDLTPNQTDIFIDTSNVGWSIGRADDIHLEDSLSSCGGKQVHFFHGTFATPGPAFGNVVNCDFDTRGSIFFEDGIINLSTCIFSIGNATSQMLKQTGGVLRVTNCEFENNVTLINPMIEVDGTAGGIPILQLTNCIFRFGGEQTVLRTVGESTTIFTGNFIRGPINVAFTKPLVKVEAGSKITFNSNRTLDKGTGSGNLLEIAEDNFHIVTGNAFQGWGLSLPATLTFSTVKDNPGIMQGDFVNNYVVGRTVAKRFIGTADAAGVVSVAHGIPAGHFKITEAKGYYKGSVGGEMRLLTFNFIDGGTLAFTGAAANAPYRVVVEWTETSHAW